MKIAFIHYHLKTGGVTTVLGHQIEALKNECDTMVLTGEPGDRPFAAETVIISGLAYDALINMPVDPEKTAESVAGAIRHKWPNGCDVVHVHNPTLAKNKHFLKVLKALQERDFNLFLQIHDFAEDGRPNIYFFEEYPADCHYGVINTRDYNTLLEAGLEPEGLHYIPNAVMPFPQTDKTNPDEKIVLYPVRAIRRKNIGEALLLSDFFTEDERLCISQPPNSSVDIDSYRGWKKFAAERKMNVEWEAGQKKNFVQLIRDAEFLLTTSIAEGFGFSFAEPWTAGKLLWGRNIPDICADFETAGVRLNHLYIKIDIPLDWIGESVFRRRWTTVVNETSRLYGRPVQGETVNDFYDRMISSGLVDFGILDEHFQKIVLSVVLEDSNAKSILIDLNPCLRTPGRVVKPAALIMDNRNKIVEHYSKERYKQRLLTAYAAVGNIPVRHRIDKNTLFRKLFDLNTFSLLKWGNYVDEG